VISSPVTVYPSSATEFREDDDRDVVLILDGGEEIRHIARDPGKQRIKVIPGFSETTDFVRVGIVPSITIDIVDLSDI